MQDEWISPKAAADYLGVIRDTIYKWCRDGKLEHVKINARVIRISRASIEKLMSASKQGE